MLDGSGRKIPVETEGNSVAKKLLHNGADHTGGAGISSVCQIISVAQMAMHNELEEEKVEDTPEHGNKYLQRNIPVFLPRHVHPLYFPASCNPLMSLVRVSSGVTTSSMYPFSAAR